MHLKEMYHTQTREWVIPRRTKQDLRQGSSPGHHPSKSTTHVPARSLLRENPTGKKDDARRQVQMPKLATRTAGSTFQKINEAFILKSK